MNASRVAVIDIGKTNAKLVVFDLQAGREIAARTTPNRVIDTSPYPHFDTEALFAFLKSALAELHRAYSFEAISITAHGATIVVLDEAGELALPVLDYEYAGPEETAYAYRAMRPPFAETGSPPLPGGLNVGAQLFWQAKSFPKQFANVATILTYPQYWAYRLTGVLANEITSIGCHTDLWNPWAADYSTLVDRMGWRKKMPPMRRADEKLGPLRRDIAAETGLPADMPVYCGLHDSNASLLPHLWAASPPFSVVSTGTWVVIMAVGGRAVALDDKRDTLVNVNALGQPVPSARFMGGRAFQLLAPQGLVPVTEGERRRVLDGTIAYLPSLPSGSGPYPDREGRFTVEEAGLTPGERLLVVSWYLALMSATCLDLIGADGDTIVEGPFAVNGAYLDMLSVATGRPVRVSEGSTGTSLGTAGLVLGDKAHLAPKTALHGVRDGEALAAYARAWRGMVG
ncbi:MAG: carbohydrate kinase [Rhizobiales bacterium 63-7]|nr:FGGY-family carbohydrate kinase [Hyphomicrobiales bacterium]OJU65973.1 MAG: carbohydrate kinase [Rhizobiales bacterium 63-7]